MREMDVDANAIHRQNGSNLSVCVHKARGAVVGQLGKLRPIVNRPDPEGTPAFGMDSGGSQPPRRLPAQCHSFFPKPEILNWLWGGQSCPQPPFRRLFRAVRESSHPASAD